MWLPPHLYIQVLDRHITLLVFGLTALNRLNFVKLPILHLRLSLNYLVYVYTRSAHTLTNAIRWCQRIWDVLWWVFVLNPISLLYCLRPLEAGSNLFPFYFESKVVCCLGFIWEGESEYQCKLWLNLWEIPVCLECVGSEDLFCILNFVNFSYVWWKLSFISRWRRTCSKPRIPMYLRLCLIVGWSGSLSFHHA